MIVVTKDKPFPQIKDRYDQKIPDTVFEVRPLRASELIKDIYLINHDLLARCPELEGYSLPPVARIGRYQQEARSNAGMQHG